MPFLKFALIILLFVILCNSAYNQEIITDKGFTIQKFNLKEQGITETVNAIFQDSRGFIWFLAGFHLIRFDGYDYKLFYDPNLRFVGFDFLGMNNIIETNNSGIWAGGNYGLSRFDIYKENFHYTSEEICRDNSFSNKAFTSIIEDNFNNIWTGSYVDLIRLNKNGDSYTCEKFTDSQYSSELIEKIDSLISKQNKRVAGILEVENSKRLRKSFKISTQLSVLVVATGDFDPLSNKLGDYGWIEDDKNNLIWDMSNSKTKNGGGRTSNRIAIDTITFKPGKYHLYYNSNESFGFNDWGSLIFKPDREDFWGIQILAINLQEKKQIATFLNKNDKNYNLSGNRIFDLFKDKNGDIWVCTTNGLDRIVLDKFSGKIVSIQNYGGPIAKEQFYTFKIINEDTINKQLKIYAHLYKNPLDKAKRSLVYFDKEKLTFSKIEDLSFKGNNYLTPMNHFIGGIEDRFGGIWIGETNGLFYSKSSNDNFELVYPINMPVTGLCIGNEGEIWVSTVKGIFKIEFSPKESFKFISNSNEKVISSKKDLYGNIWFQTSNKGFDEANLVYYNPEKHEVTSIESKKGSFLFNSMEDEIWANDPSKGQLEKYDAKNQFFEEVFNWGSYLELGYSDNKILFFLDREVKYFFFRKNLKKILPLKLDTIQLSTHLYSLFHLDQDKYLWVISGKTLYKFEWRNNGICKLLKSFPMPDIGIYAQLKVGKDDKLWISTLGGLVAFDKVKEKFNVFSTTKHIGDPLFTIVEDKNDNLWLISSKGNYRFNKKTGQITYSFKLDRQNNNFQGFPFDFINEPLTTGEIFVPAENGFYLFHPDSLDINDSPPQLAFKNFWISNKLITPKDSTILSQSITYTNKITLKHFQNDLAIEYVGIHYKNPEKTQYAYYLENWEDDWNYVQAERIARYTNLPPGKYIFKLKAANADGIWNDKPLSLTITILPPWYWSPITQSLYTLLLIGLIYYFYRFQLNRRLAQAEATRLRELDQVKTSLYTNITHEFRTPLTIILGMADKVEQAPRQWLQEGIQMIKRNGQSLLRLVNQMLDLSKLEAGSLPVNMVQGDIVAYLRTLVEFFRSYADSKNIKLEFASEYEAFVMDYDADKIKDIISNLLSNALKFTPAGGEIKLEVRGTKYVGEDVLRTSTLVLCVRDTGVGIPAEKLPHIFDRFYQADDSATRQGEGTGIGLALTKELVRLLGGAIEVESKLGEGSVFKVWLPVRNTAPLLDNTLEVEPAMTAFATPEPVKTKKGMASLPQMLIVEDNTDVISYLRSCLQDQYRIEVAYNGQEGIDKAIEIVPDIIISDVMMPEKDGFELCRTLKDDMRTSHIPIVLLTARADMDSRLEGLEGGADAYLTKPFNEQELEVSLRKSLELRQRLRERYANDLPIEQEKIFSRDDAFITKLHQVLEAHYSGEDFNIPALAAAMELSHAQLGRKLHALLDTTPQLYLRHYRLQKAYQLLKHSDLSVKEVAFATGFSDPAYFSNAFLDEFQQRPSDFRE